MIKAKKTLRILLIEDNDLVAGTMRAFAEKFGHSLDIAEDGELGLQKLKVSLENKDPYDLIFVDWGLPKGTIQGLPLLVTIKDAFRNAYIVLSSGTEEISIPDEAMKLLDDVMPKPAKLSDFQQVFKNFYLARNQKDS